MAPVKLPNRLREIRKQRGLTQQQLAEMIGTSNQQIGHLEVGERRLSAPWIEKLVEALGITAGELFEPAGGEIALVSWAQAGSFADTVDLDIPHDTPRIAVAGLRHDQHIALIVEEDSMDRIAPPGAMIVVDLRDRELIDGREYVVRMYDRATFKRWRSDPPRLEPDTTGKHDSIFPKTAVVVVGRVVKVIVDL